jgi:hypothetical protein
MYGTIKNIESIEQTIPTLSVAIEIRNDEQKEVNMIGYSIELSLCNVTIGNVHRFRKISLVQGGTQPIKENFQLQPFIFQSIERERKGATLMSRFQLRFSGSTQLAKLAKYVLEVLTLIKLILSPNHKDYLNGIGLI